MAWITQSVSILLLSVSSDLLTYNSGGDMEERTSEAHTAFHIALKHGHIPILKYFFETYPTNDEDTVGIYSLPGPSSLLGLAIESRVPEAVWMILDNKLFQRKEIADVWKNLSSPAGTAAFINGIERKNVKSTAKKDVFDEVMNLITRFGGFTRPPTPPVYDPANPSESIPPREPPRTSSSGPRPGLDGPSGHHPAVQSHARSENQPEESSQGTPKRNASDKLPSDVRPDASQTARSSRGRSRRGGRGRGRGRGRGGP